MKSLIVLIFCFSISINLVFSQNEKRRVMRFEVIDGDTIPIYTFDDVIIKDLKDAEAERRYLKLVRDIKKTLPYAKLAAFRLQMLEDNLNLLPTEKARKEYIRQTEKAIKEEFMGDLKNLTMSQGKLLIRLMHRETGQTSYQILKIYRGDVITFFWQSLAFMFGANLKNTYDPVEDFQIEYIIKNLQLE